MARHRLFPGIAVLCAAVVSVLSAQSAPVPANNEAHHWRLLYTNDFRVFDVTIPPGEASSDHVHEHDMATLVIAEGTLRISRNGQDVPAAPSARGSVTVADHSGATTYRIQNTGTTAYHAIEIENMREDGKWLTLAPLTAPGTSTSMQTRAFTIYDGLLKADMGEVRHEHTWSTFLVVVEGTFENGGIGGEAPVRLTRPGQWLTFPRAQAHTVSAVGGDAHVIEIEAH